MQLLDNSREFTKAIQIKIYLSYFNNIFEILENDLHPTFIILQFKTLNVLKEDEFYKSLGK